MPWSRVWLLGSYFGALLCLSSVLITQVHGQDVMDPQEVKALQAIRKSLIDPNQNLSNWRGNEPCASNWTGVICYNTTKDDGYLHTKELQLLNMNLSGTLSPELGRLSFMQILDVMWNNITGSIPREIGNITSLELLLLNGNQLSGSLPDEIGFLPNLDRIQIDQNKISGPLPSSFANLNMTKHFHMNNNSLSGQIPPELSRLPKLVHMLLDNNNLSGYLPPELAALPQLLILQLDNNNFNGTTIPPSYANMSRLLKLSLRNCSLQGPIPDLSNISRLAYIDLSRNQFNGSIPQNLSENMTTIDLSENNFNGSIPASYSALPRLERLLLKNNSLSGFVGSAIWRKRNGIDRLVVDLQNNELSGISGSLDLPPNVTVRLDGNPFCSNASLVQFCQTQDNDLFNNNIPTTTVNGCPTFGCPLFYEYAPAALTNTCFCAAPLLVEYRLKSPGFSDFTIHVRTFEQYLTEGLVLKNHQLNISSVSWQKGPRLKMDFKIFPVNNDNRTHEFNTSEVRRIRSMFTGWNIPDSDLFGPYELIEFPLLGPYANVIQLPSKSGISKGAWAGIILGTIAGAVTLSALVSILILRIYMKKQQTTSKRRQLSKMNIKIDGVKDFTFRELELATNNFDNSSQVGQGGYGKVYRGNLSDGTVVAIKRAQEGSLQGQKEFFTEIELLSRLHHRNLVSLLGYCDEEGEQMLVYEFMPNGTLRDHLSGKSKAPLGFAMRLRLALNSAKGILYLHTEANPPIFHRDIKSSNILLDSRFTAKVADFGLSRLAPVPDVEGFLPEHVSTVVKGTPGYLDPEYFLTHKLTDKSDVYSLGVVFLELLTGMHPISHGKNIVREVNLAHRSGMIFSIIDDKMGSYPSECVEKFVNLALKCCQEETDLRPSMADVVRELDIIWAMTPQDSDTRITDHSLTPNSGKNTATPPSSSSGMRHLDLSTDISGSDLLSGILPSIGPR
ncbi:probable LRR receptor-like serine/threonine-protein kinase At1g06840 [Impatiens glandulifera]|uniref:probable LRR receptor-like serine/threonine-protein kinase At1g06840 n=1 Tax=Impatiens glandulifera TaxID=253017 RepID=UPI001FB083EF|nr:probable LRR receptor-like serine/threonine-protein kinase At1g06840 [Impatiens glandulifera]XP_047337534.1 probable LRR receptor-like serine/threonine-protein kinase At1g06840 [Impatiens glandulifera]